MQQKKIAQDLTISQKARRAVNVGGRAAETLNPAFRKVIRNMDKLDKKVRKEAEELNYYIGMARSMSRRRDYLTAATWLVKFHEKAKQINFDLAQFDADISKDQKAYLLKNFKNKDKEKLFSYDPNKELKAEKYAASALKDWWRTPSAFSDTVHRLTDNKSRGMKALQKSFSGPFLKSLVEETRDMTSKTNDFYKNLLQQFATMGSAWARRNVGEYITATKELESSYKPYNSAFVKYYDKNIVPMKAEQSRLDAEEFDRQKEMGIENPVIAPSPFSVKSDPFPATKTLSLPTTESEGIKEEVSPSSHVRVDDNIAPRVRVGPPPLPAEYRDHVYEKSEFDKPNPNLNEIDNDWTIPSLKTHPLQETKWDKADRNIFDVPAVPVSNIDKGWEDEIHAPPRVSAISYPAYKQPYSLSPSYKNPSGGPNTIVNSTPPAMSSKKPSTFRTDLVPTTRNFKTPDTYKNEEVPDTHKEEESPKTLRSPGISAHQKFLDKIEVLSSEKDIIREILHYSQVLESHSEEDALKLLAVAEGLLEKTAAGKPAAKKKEPSKPKPEEVLELDEMDAPYPDDTPDTDRTGGINPIDFATPHDRMTPFNHGIPLGDVNQKWQNFPFLAQMRPSNITITAPAIRHILEKLSAYFTHHFYSVANVPNYQSKLISLIRNSLSSGHVVSNWKCGGRNNPEDCSMEVRSFIQMKDIDPYFNHSDPRENENLWFHMSLRISHMGGELSIGNISKLEIK